MSDRIGTLLILSCLVFVLSSCAPDAPHDNPLDPKSPNYKSTGTLSGKVLTLGIPYTGIPNASVLIVQNGTSQLTASDGSFSFAAAPAGNITLVISRQAYLADTMSLTLDLGQTRDVEIHLDAIPKIAGAQVVSSKIDQWWPAPDYSATVRASVTDPDGVGDVIDSTVHVQVDSFSFTLSHSTGNIYESTIDASQLPNQDIEWLVGKVFVVSATDHENGIGQSPPFYVSRVIESEANPTYPTGLDTTVASPELDWNPPSVAFDYTYELQVVIVVQGSQRVVWTQPGLSSSIVSFKYPSILAQGDYFWTVTIVDGLGNTSTSKEATFHVP